MTDCKRGLPNLFCSADLGKGLIIVTPRTFTSGACVVVAGKVLQGFWLEQPQPQASEKGGRTLLPVVVGDRPVERASGPAQHGFPKGVHGRHGFDDFACTGALATPCGRCANDLLRVFNATLDRFRENGIELVHAAQDLADHRFDGEDLCSKRVGVPVKAFCQSRSLKTPSVL